MVVRFWEARIAAGRLDDALRWTKETLHPRMADRPGFVSGQVFVAENAELAGKALSNALDMSGARHHMAETTSRTVGQPPKFVI